MGKMDELKDKLLALQPGQSIKVHESTIAEALQEARHPLHYYPSADTAFQWWCADNRLSIAYLPVEDYVLFEAIVTEGGLVSGCTP